MITMRDPFALSLSKCAEGVLQEAPQQNEFEQNEFGYRAKPKYGIKSRLTETAKGIFHETRRVGVFFYC